MSRCPRWNKVTDWLRFYDRVMRWIPLVPYLHILFYICLTLIAVNTWQNESLSLPGNENPADRIYLPVLSLHIVWPQELSPVLPCKRWLVQECFRTGLPVVYIKNWNLQCNNMLTDKNNTFSLWKITNELWSDKHCFLQCFSLPHSGQKVTLPKYSF